MKHSYQLESDISIDILLRYSHRKIHRPEATIAFERFFDN